MKQNSKKGFSLVEIITVVAIIVLLAGVTAIGVAEYMSRADNVSDKDEEHMAQVVLARNSIFQRLLGAEDAYTPNPADGDGSTAQLNPGPSTTPTPTPTSDGAEGTGATDSGAGNAEGTGGTNSGNSGNSGNSSAITTTPDPESTSTSQSTSQSTSPSSGGGSYAQLAGSSTTLWWGGGEIKIEGGRSYSSVTVAVPDGIHIVENSWSSYSVNDNHDGTYTITGSNISGNSFQFSTDYQINSNIDNPPGFFVVSATEK